MHEKNTNNSLANIAKSFGLKGLGFPQDETSDSRPDLTLGRIALKDFSNARVLDRLLMYERRIEHSLYKTTLELQRLRLLKTLEHPNAAVAAPPFTRRCQACLERSRRDDALTPNSTPHDGIHIHQEPIINNQSSIVNIESPPIQPPSPKNNTLYYAKQTQCQNGQDEHKHSGSKALCQQTTNSEQRTLSKTNPNKANFCISGPVHRV
jgi:hypothetical protein